MNPLKTTALLLLLSVFSPFFGQSLEFKPIGEGDTRDSTELDLTLLAGVGFLTLGLEISKNSIGPKHPNYTDPGDFDEFFRNKLVWSPGNIGKASVLSDILFGILTSQALLDPLIAGSDFWRTSIRFTESIVYTAFLTDIIKLVSARERPYAYHDNIDNKSVEDNLSFLSGHTSISFAMATTGALFLSERFPRLKILFYSLLYGAAGLTAYLRIASDNHYMTDVLAGAALGTGVSLALYQRRNTGFQFLFIPDGVAIQKSF